MGAPAAPQDGAGWTNGLDIAAGWVQTYIKRGSRVGGFACELIRVGSVGRVLGVGGTRAKTLGSSDWSFI